jgi:hypothetical protein
MQIRLLYSSPNIIEVIKQKRIRWEGHVARMEGRSVQGFGGKNLREIDYLEDLGVDGRIILNRY